MAVVQNLEQVQGNSMRFMVRFTNRVDIRNRTLGFEVPANGSQGKEARTFDIIFKASGTFSGSDKMVMKSHAGYFRVKRCNIL